ncbi:MAG: metallophosphoesterase [Candidatus Micrarchaeota archaeon]
MAQIHAAGLAVAIPLLALLYSLHVEPYRLSVTETRVDFFEGAGDGVKVVLITDTQTAYDHPDFFARAIDTINAQEPDIILISGDIVEGEPGGWKKLGELERLRSKNGIYAVLGNHDYIDWRCGIPENERYADEVEKTLESMGIIVLRNENVNLTINGRTFPLAGVDDLWACKSDYDAAIRGAGEPMIILAHNNLAAKDAKEGSLVLSGHTHCGQVDVPIITDLIVESLDFGKTKRGLGKTAGGAQLYVSCGLSPGGIRLFAPPEISVIYLE